MANLSHRFVVVDRCAGDARIDAPHVGHELRQRRPVPRFFLRINFEQPLPLPLGIRRRDEAADQFVRQVVGLNRLVAGRVTQRLEPLEDVGCQAILELVEEPRLLFERELFKPVEKTSVAWMTRSADSSAGYFLIR